MDRRVEQGGVSLLVKVMMELPRLRGASHSRANLI